MIMNTKIKPILRPFLLAATLAAGFGTLWFVLTVWLGTSVGEAWRDRSQIRLERLVVTADGTPLIESYPLDNYSLVSYRDLNGKVRDSLERKDLIPAVYLYGEQETGNSFF